MSEWNSKMKGIIDGHVHMGPIAEEEAVLKILEITGIEKINFVSIQNPEEGSGLAQSFYMKARHPGTFFVFAGLNHGAKLSEGSVSTPSLAEQVDTFMEIGCDGLKMIEGKPTSRRKMDVPVNDPYFADYWARVEELQKPVVWHVADPEEFWNPETIPAWAKEKDWGYRPDDVQKEQLYAEVDEVLARHPRLRIIFAHFYFLSADLPRAARFLDEHPSVQIDLTPGVEMLYNVSRDPDEGREFFLKYADQIVFGTDLFSYLTPEQGLYRAGITFRWLESEDEFRVHEDADFLLGPPDDGVIRGMSLPDDVLVKIYRENFQKLASPEPKPLNVDLAVEECNRQAAIAEAMSGKPRDETEAGKVAKNLA